MSPTRTYHAKGARMVEVKRSKGGKMLSTALLAVFSTGLKLPIYWVSKGSTDVDIDEDLKPYIISRSGNSGWMDTISLSGREAFLGLFLRFFEQNFLFLGLTSWGELIIKKAQ